MERFRLRRPAPGCLHRARRETDPGDHEARSVLARVIIDLPWAKTSFSVCSWIAIFDIFLRRWWLEPPWDEQLSWGLALHLRTGPQHLHFVCLINHNVCFIATASLFNSLEGVAPTPLPQNYLFDLAQSGGARILQISEVTAAYR